MTKRKIVVSWSINVEWDNGEVTEEADCPNYVTQAVDEWLTEVENDN